jgi:hypothetical protein
VECSLQTTGCNTVENSLHGGSFHTSVRPHVFAIQCLIAEIMLAALEIRRLPRITNSELMFSTLVRPSWSSYTETVRNLQLWLP